jgi:hypothetical protein
MKARVERSGPIVMGWVLVLGIAAGMGSCVDEDDDRRRKKNGPELHVVTPSSGSTLGGITVAILTRNFKDDFHVHPPTVTFGGIPAPIVQVVNPRELYVQAPPAAGPGPVDVTIETTGVFESATCVGCYDYFAAPPCTITGISPSTGFTAGGEAVTITGADFGHPASRPRIFFGAVEALAVIWLSPQQLEVYAPPAAGAQPGAVDVTVNPVGAQPCVCPGCFTYLPPDCDISGVTPAAGFVTGGEPVTLLGTGFEPGSTVLFGASPSQNVVVAPGGDSIACVTPAAAGPGWTSVSVQGPSTSCDLPNAYRYLAVGGCQVDSVWPPAGHQAGGDTIWILGLGFQSTPPPVVEFVRGGPPVPSPSVTWIDSTTLEAVTPAWPAAESVDVLVTNTVSGLDCTLAEGFRFIAPGECGLFDVTPPFGAVAGGYDVTLTGVGLSPAPLDILFGAEPVDPTTIRWIDSTTVIVEVPASGSAGIVDVTYVNPALSCTIPSGFEYTADICRITGVDPPAGPPTGGTWIEILGSGFPPDARVLFDNVMVNPSFVTVTPTRITTISPGLLGMGCVNICVIGGGGGCCLEDAYCTTGGCTITDVAPGQGPMTGRTLVTITGTDFDPSGYVRFGPLFSPSVTFIGPTEIQAETPPSLLPGSVDVHVLGSQFSQCVATQAFEYVPGSGGGGCAIAAVSPSSGSSPGGDRVTIVGSGFDPGPPVPAIVFGLVPGVNVAWLDASTLEVDTPPALYPGSVDVHVVNANGDACSLSGGFDYDPLPPCTTTCTLIAVLPDFGPLAGGGQVTITGSGFCVGSRVYFGSSPATVIAVSPTAIDVVVPPRGAPGMADIHLIDPEGGICYLLAAYEYR